MCSYFLRSAAHPNDVEAKCRAMMGMGTLVSDSVRPHSDKTRMMCSGTSE